MWGRTRDTYCRHPFVLVKWILSQTHHHRQYDVVFGGELGRLIVHGIHSGISIVNPRFGDASHVCDGIIGQIG